ncbi:MAG: radical SAM protein [Thermoanaerobacterales bacterium]|nr:radical SAM protein [Thermoanaerobacterales bacterium]
MLSLKPNLDFAKRYVEEQTLRQLLDYIGKDPGKNLPRIASLARLVARAEHHRRHVDMILRHHQENPVIRDFIHRLFTRTHPKVKERLLYNWFINAQIIGIPRQRQLSEQLGINIPNFFLIDPTSSCNLACTGCWAGRYAPKDVLGFETLDRLLKEAKELGIYWVVMSGGEPFKYPRLIELCSRHSDMAFMLYTNGTLITEKVADAILNAGNMTPSFSLEGWREATDARRGPGVFDRVMRAMDLLRERGMVFGVSVTITRHNLDEIVSDAFIDFLLEKGVTYGWSFHYVPVGRNPDPDLMITPEQRAYLAERIPYIRMHKGLMIADFWNDGELTGGCIAGGRRYFHITAAGDVEPCAFAHFAMDNIKEKSLKDVLSSPLFKAYQKRQPFAENLLRPCPIIDCPAALRAIVAESGARPTHEGADAILFGDLAAALDRRSAAWAEVADPIWEARQTARQQAEKSAAAG